VKLVNLLTLTAFSAALAFSQGFSSLTARITDTSGGAIVGAVVEATNLDTSAKRSVLSDATGTVALNQMVPGRYIISLVGGICGWFGRVQ
jgi:hypothetical protein